MNSRDIYNALRNDRRTSPVFSGVFPSDKLPMNKINYPSAFVVNLDKSSQEGSHWIAIYFDHAGRSELFDSYGTHPLPDAILRFLHRHTLEGRTKRNEKQLQSFFSTVCGAYVIFYIMHRVRGTPMDTIVNMFDVKDKGYNDRHVQEFVNKRTNRQHPVIDAKFVRDQFARAFYGIPR